MTAVTVLYCHSATRLETTGMKISLDRPDKGAVENTVLSVIDPSAGEVGGAGLVVNCIPVGNDRQTAL